MLCDPAKKMPLEHQLVDQEECIKKVLVWFFSTDSIRKVSIYHVFSKFELEVTSSEPINLSNA